jgi:hypothetical protein
MERRDSVQRWPKLHEPQLNGVFRGRFATNGDRAPPDATVRHHAPGFSFLSRAWPRRPRQPQSLGVFGSWGAFRDGGRCYAIAQPGPGPRAGSPSPRSATGPGGRRRPAPCPAEPREAAGLGGAARIDGRTFQLLGGGRDAWAPDARADAEIQAAMRTGIEMVVETRSTRAGLIVRDLYRLRGAATAMDAAAIACARG